MVDWCLAGVVLATLAALCWMTWLYILTYRQLVWVNRDRDRLLKRIGLYHSIPLMTPYDKLPELPAETPIPPAFRMKRPVPPPGWKGKV